MALFSRRRTTVGLDIGSGFVKLTLVDHGGDGPEVGGVAVRRTPAGAIVDGEVVERKPIADTVRELMREAGAGSREVVVAMSGHDVFIKKVDIPRMKEVEALRMMRREAGRHVPFDLEGVHLDCQILRPRDEGARMEVLLAAARRERVEDRTSLLAEAGVRIAVMDVEAFALHNAFTHNYPEAGDGIVALVDVGHRFTNLNVIEGGIPVLTKELPLGSRNVAESLQREYGLSGGEAERVLQGRQPMEGIQRVVADGVATGIKRASAYLGGRRSGAGIGRIFLSGGGACMPGMAEALAQRVKIETRLVNPFERVPLRAGVREPGVLARAAPMLLLPVGLALRAS
ncbi:MAG: type IV pilus assembly protein PilM [Gemmatimonadota bacterium]|nr:type IV pilus assembly protein PilM [Gemmatimonadota bacterium]MDE2870495.1 type IV pilus assembly protein PilM [Gemmatimonadota bacterium]